MTMCLSSFIWIEWSPIPVKAQHPLIIPMGNEEQYCYIWLVDLLDVTKSQLDELQFDLTQKINSVKNVYM